MADIFVERHRSLMSEGDDMYRHYKKLYFRLWKFQMLKPKFVGMLVRARPGKRNEALKGMKAEIRTIGLKQDVEEILAEWEKTTQTVKQEFGRGRLAVQHYLDSMHFPFEDPKTEMPESDCLELRYDPDRKGYEFQRVDDQRSEVHKQFSIPYSESVSWQTAYDEDPMPL